MTSAQGHAQTDSQVSEAVDVRVVEEDRSPHQQLQLPLDEPIPYELTARARRAVAPRAVPDLRLVKGAEATQDEPADEPPPAVRARARALRRAGHQVSDIAASLDVDELVVTAWTTDIQGVSRRLHPVAGRFTRPADGGEPNQAFQQARATAEAELASRLSSDPRFARGLGLVVATATTTPFAVTMASGDLATLHRALQFLHHVTDLGRLNVQAVVRSAATSGRDLVVHRVAQRLAIPPGDVTHVHWPEAVDGDDLEVRVRIQGPEVAGAVAGWREAFLGLSDLDDDALGREQAF